MRKLIFPTEPHTLLPDNSYVYTGPGRLGLFELIWTGINVSSKKLDKSGHKIIKRLRLNLKEISVQKDKDNDSRVLAPSKDGHVVILEEDEFKMLKALLDEVQFKASLSEEVANMYEFLDNVEFYKPSLAVEQSA